MTGPHLSRRALILVGGGLTLSACSSSGSRPTPTTVSPTAPPPTSTASLTGDLALVGLAAAVENALIYAYQKGIDAANSGLLGSVPPAFVTLLTTVKAHHTQHATSWNGFLDKNKKPIVTDFPLTEAQELATSLSAMKDLNALATILLRWENIAASTCIQAAGQLSAPAGIATGLAIAPVEAEHATVLSFLLGKTPTPSALFETSTALSLAAYVR